MSALTCDRCRSLLMADYGAALHHADLAAHLQSCVDCDRFAGALGDGEAAWLDEDAAVFTARVLARTSAADAIVAELPALAEMDPGPGFTERVLLHTSQRPAPVRWRGQWAAAWRMLVGRPRFAWEVAYVATLCFVLAFGRPLSAWEWGSDRVTSAAQQRLGRAASDLRQDLEAWRARLAPDVPEAAAPPGTGAADAPGTQGTFEAAWRSASNWVRSRLAQVVDALIDLWQRAAAWIAGPEPAGQPAAGTEPRRDTARSPQ